MSLLRDDQIQSLRALFDLFDGDGDGYLEVDECGAVLTEVGVVLTEAEVLDLVTELKPSLRKLPFEEFVNMMCRPMVSTEALEEQLRSTFPTFSGGKANITPSSLVAGMAELGRPVDPLVAEEMLREAERTDDGKGGDGKGKVGLSEFCLMNSIREKEAAVS